jgi:hypothetical protein
MTADQYDEEQLVVKIQKDKQFSSSLIPAINAGSKRAASKKKIEFDDFVDDTSFSKSRKKNRHTGKIILLFLISIVLH